MLGGMIFFFYGPNTYALRQELRRLINTYVDRTGSNFGLERIDGTGVTKSELKSSLQAVPLLSTSRLVIIEGLGANKTVAEHIGELLQDMPESTVAAFVDPEVDRRTSYFKTLAAEARTVDFPHLSGAKLDKWIRQEVARQGAKITPAASRRLVEVAGEDQWRLAAEIAKLASFRPEITPITVDELVEPGFGETIFNLVDAMTAGRSGTALKLYRGLILQRTNEIYILTMIIWQLRNLLLAKAAGDLPPNELAKQAGLSPYVSTKAVAKRLDFSLDTLKEAFSAAVDCEYRIKSGQSPAEAAVEQLIYQVAVRARQ